MYSRQHQSQSISSPFGKHPIGIKIDTEGYIISASIVKTSTAHIHLNGMWCISRPAPLIFGQAFHPNPRIDIVMPDDYTTPCSCMNTYKTYPITHYYDYYRTFMHCTPNLLLSSSFSVCHTRLRSDLCISAWLLRVFIMPH